MAYQTKNPVLNTVITEDHSSKPATPVAGNAAFYMKNNALTSQDSAGTETTYGAASAATPDASGTITSFVPVIKSSTKAVASTNYTVLDTDGFDKILVTTGASDRTITLPTASANTGRSIKILKVDSGAGKVILDGEGAETVGGRTTFDLMLINDFAEIVCDGTTWVVVAYREIGTWSSAGLVAGDFLGFGTGTVSDINIQSRKIGQSIEFLGDFVTGGTLNVNTTGSMAINATVAIVDANSNKHTLGMGWRHASSTGTTILNILGVHAETLITFGIGAPSYAANPMDPQDAEDIVGTSERVSIRFTVPVSEYTSSTPV